MKISIKKIEIPKGRRILATSDIHGEPALLQKLLDQVHFSHNDILFIVGDLIEKGHGSLEALRYVMNLAKKENVTVLMGNVDLLRVQMLENLSEESSEKFYGYLRMMRNRARANLFDEIASELGIFLDSPKKALDSKELLLKGLKDEFDFIRSLPTVAETKNYIFVHGGLPNEDLEALKEEDIYKVLKFDNFMAAGLTFKKYLVVGHYPVNIYNDKILQNNPIINTGQHIISMDGGCGINKDGQLNMIIIPDIDCSIEDVTYASCDNLPVLEALTPQEASSSSVNLHFLNNKVEIMDEGEEFSYVKHKASGRRFKVLTKSLYNRREQRACVHYTDYRLPVRVGDRLSLVEKTSDGYYVKKDGVCGWYRGEVVTVHTM